MSDSHQGGMRSDRVVVLVADVQGTIVAASDGAESVLGLQGIVGRPLFDICDGLGSAVVADVASGVSGPVRSELRHSVPGSGGRTVPVRVQRFEDGTHVVATLVGPEPTEPEPGEPAPGEPAPGGAMHLVRAASSEGIWDWDLRSGEVWWSPEMRAMLGRADEAAVGPIADRFNQVMHPEDLPAAQAALERLLVGTATVYTVEARIQVAPETYRWFLIRGACERSEAGEPVRVAGSILDIHDRRLAEDRVAESERRYRELAHRLPQIVWSAQPDGAVVELNDRFHELTGLPRGVVGDEAWLPAVHPEDRASMVERWQRSVVSGEPYEHLFRLRVHGSYRWYLAQARPAPGDDGTIRAWYGTGTDVHDARTAEIERDESRRRLESTVDGAALGIWDWSLADGRVVINDRWAEIVGRERHELEPVTIQTWRDLCHPDDLWRAESELRRHLRGESDRYELELRMRHGNGHDVWVRTCGRVLERDAAGRAVRMYGLHEDISDRRRMQEQLEKSEQGFRRLFEGAADAMLLLAGERIVDANEAAALMFGVPGPARLVGGRIGQRSPARQPDGTASATSLLRRIEDAVAGGQPRFEWTHLREDGETVRVETILTSLPGPGEPLVHAVLRDIGERKRLEESLKRSIAAAQDASRAKSEFLANMSHEIRTPMTAILGFVELVERELRTGDRTVLLPEAMVTIRRNAEHLLDLINDILDLSRIEAGRMDVRRRPSSPAQVIDEVVELMRVRAHEKGLSIKVEIEPAVPAALETDPGRLRQVLVNLVGNAIKFTHAGEVRIRASRAAGGGGEPGRAPGGTADDMGRGGGPRLLIEVEDTGIGMTAEQCRIIFDAFVQADASTTRTFGGTGLGLRISASLVEMLGGSISVRSEPGAGSCFTVELPLSADVGDESGSGTEAEADIAGAPGDGRQGLGGHEGRGGDDTPDGEAAPWATAPRGSASPLSGVRILLAEDAGDVRRLLMLLLEGLGATVVLARDGLEAIQAVDLATGEGRPFDVVLMDMQMPVLDGYGATSRLRATGHRMPIIAITAHAMSGDREQCLAVGCDDHVAKPCSQSELLAVIRRWLPLAADGRGGSGTGIQG